MMSELLTPDELAEVYSGERVINALGRPGRMTTHDERLLAKALARERERTTALRELLRRIASWDMLSLNAEGKGAATGDAPYWRAEIERALAASSSAEQADTGE